MKNLLYFLLYISDGTAWLLGVWLVLTGFFGYRVPKSKKRPLGFALAIFVYAFVNLGIRLYMARHNISFGILYEGMVLFVAIYWMCQPVYYQEGCKKLRIREKLFLVICALEMVCGIVIISSWGYQMLSKNWSDGINAKALLLSAAGMNMVPIFIIWLFSRLSSKNRKEPMAFSVCFVSFLFFMLLDTAINFLGPDVYTEMVEPVVTFRIFFDGTESPNEVVSIITFCVVIIICVLAIVAIVKESERLYLQKKNAMNEYYLEMQKKHYESLMESNREIRKIKHDMKNHMYCMEQLRATGRYEELEAYIKELSEHLEQADITVHTGCEIADAIISERKRVAEEKGIRFTAEGNISNLEMSALHICTIFSNILDNALEAVEKLEKDKKWVNVCLKKNKNFFLISVSNPVEKEVKIDNNTVSTTKNDREKHGFGMDNVKDAVSKYEGDVKLSQKDGVFYVEIMIPG